MSGRCKCRTVGHHWSPRSQGSRSSSPLWTRTCSPAGRRQPCGHCSPKFHWFFANWQLACMSTIANQENLTDSCWWRCSWGSDRKATVLVWCRSATVGVPYCTETNRDWVCPRTRDRKCHRRSTKSSNHRPLMKCTDWFVCSMQIINFAV